MRFTVCATVVPTMYAPVPGKVNYLKVRFKAGFGYVSNAFDARASGLTHALGHVILVLLNAKHLTFR